MDLMGAIEQWFEYDSDRAPDFLPGPYESFLGDTSVAEDISRVVGAVTTGAGNVITSIGDVHVGSWYGLLAAIYSFRPDESADVVLIRDGEEQTVNVTFGSDAE